MMNSNIRKVLFINLNKHSVEVKSFDNYGKYIGGIGLGAKVLSDFDHEDSVVFSVGPLSGFFPCASKTSILFKNSGQLEDLYIGGALSSRIKFTGLNSIVVYGKSKESVSIEIIDGAVSFKSDSVNNLKSLGLPGKRSTLNVESGGLLLDEYFEVSNNLLFEILSEKNIKSISVTGTKTFEIENRERYSRLYNDILNKCKNLKIGESEDPSCFGCPLGCNQSKIGEEDGNVLVHSLVCCTYASDIYSDVGTVFSCLDVLGYNYLHEDLENFPNVVYDLIMELNSYE